MINLAKVQKQIRQQRNPQKAQFLQRFFKTGRGQYAEHDTFLGLTVPQSRAVAKQHRDLALTEVFKLLESAFHEERLVALHILVYQFARAALPVQKQIVLGYLKRIKACVNNWDLVDASALYILGRYLYEQNLPITKLKQLARSKNLWERRVAIISTFYFIRQGSVQPAIVISEMLINDRHDLIHKAVGWMLREAGKQSRPALDKFLVKHAATMPRTALRYAIEKHSPRERAAFMAMKKK